MQQLYVKLRTAIFSEAGYCLDAPELTRDATGYFRTMGVDGKHAVELDPICGCDGSGGRTICVDLTPYPDAAKAQAVLQVMCARLEAAVEGDAEARVEMAAAWSFMVNEGLMLDRQNEKTQLKIMDCIYGMGRIRDEMNRSGTLAYMPPPDWPAMLDEALPMAAERIAA